MSKSLTTLTDVVAPVVAIIPPVAIIVGVSLGIVYLAIRQEKAEHSEIVAAKHLVLEELIKNAKLKKVAEAGKNAAKKLQEDRAEYIRLDAECRELA